MDERSTQHERVRTADDGKAAMYPSDVKWLRCGMGIAVLGQRLFFGAIAAYLIILLLGLTFTDLLSTLPILHALPWLPIGVVALALIVLAIAMWMVSEPMASQDIPAWWLWRSIIIAGYPAIGFWWLTIIAELPPPLRYVLRYTCIAILWLQLFGILLLARHLNELFGCLQIEWRRTAISMFVIPSVLVAMTIVSRKGELIALMLFVLLSIGALSLITHNRRSLVRN